MLKRRWGVCVHVVSSGIRRFGVGEAVSPEVHERLEAATVGGFQRSEVGGATGGGGEGLFEGHHACWFGVSLLSFSNGVGHPRGYRFVFCENTKIYHGLSRPGLASPNRDPCAYGLIEASLHP